MITFDTPEVSILLGVRNGERYISPSIDSILEQRFGSFELIVVNDGSTDATGAVLAGYAGCDSRVRVVQNAENQGLAFSLNRALSLARGNYVARQDADDVSSTDRLSVQVDYLERNPQIGLVGGWGGVINSEGTRTGSLRRQPISDADIKWGLLFKNQFIHSSVMLRKEAVERAGGYDESFDTSQDYDLWSRMAAHCSFANIDRELVLYREHSDQIGVKKSKRQLANSRQVSRRNLAEIGAVHSDETFNHIHRVMGNSWEWSSTDIVLAAASLPAVLKSFQKHYGFSSADCNRIRLQVVAELARGLRHTRPAFRSSFGPGAKASLRLLGTILTSPHALSLSRRILLRLLGMDSSQPSPPSK